VTQQKKQIALLVVLAVGALGAGSYFFLIRDSTSDAVRRQMKDTPVKRHTRASTDDGKVDRKKRRTRATKSKVKVAPERKTREVRKTKTAERKKKKRSKGKKVKKQEQKPAA